MHMYAHTHAHTHTHTHTHTPEHSHMLNYDNIHITCMTKAVVQIYTCTSDSSN